MTELVTDLCRQDLDVAKLAAELSKVDPERALSLGLALYAANPTVHRPGTPPGSLEGTAVVRLTGTTGHTPSQRVAALRMIRESVYFNEYALRSLNLSQAADLYRDIVAGKAYEFQRTWISSAHAEAERWRRAGFVVELKLMVDQPPAQHEVSLQQELSNVCQG